MRPRRPMSAVPCAGSERSAVSRSTRWTFAPSSSRPFGIALPIPCAGPVTSATLPLSSAILVPSVLDQIANFGHACPPHLEHFGLRPLVRPTEDAVDRQSAQLVGRCLPDDTLRDHRLRA